MAPHAILRTEGGVDRSLLIGGSLRTTVGHRTKDTNDGFLAWGIFNFHV